MRVQLLLVLFPWLSYSYHFIIVPGIGGSILYNDQSRKIWPPNLIQFNPNSFRHPDDILRTTGRVGDPDSIRIDTGSVYAFTKNTYYTGLIDNLSKSNKVSAFPYDFRYIHLPDYYLHLYSSYKRYIEDHFQRTGEKSILIAHSMGGLVMQHFMNKFLTRAWMDRHLERIYFLNVPFGGSPAALYLLADHIVGKDDQQGPLMRMVLTISNMRSFGGFYVCLPTTSGYYLRWDGDMYSYKNMDDFFTGDMAWVYEMSKPFHRYAVRPPLIPHVVVHSYGKNTTIYKDYDNDISRETDGDGLVSTASLLHMPMNTYTTRVAVPNEEHSKINNNPAVQDMISRNGVSLSPNDEPPSSNRSNRLFLPRWLFLQ